MRAFYFDKGTDIGTAKDLIRAALADEGLTLLPNYPLHSVRVSGAESVNGLPTDQINVPAAAIGGLAVEATCAICGDQFYAPSDEDPSDTLCVPCSEEETA